MEYILSLYATPFCYSSCVVPCIREGTGLKSQCLSCERHASAKHGRLKDAEWLKGRCDQDIHVGFSHPSWLVMIFTNIEIFLPWATLQFIHAAHSNIACAYQVLEGADHFRGSRTVRLLLGRCEIRYHSFLLPSQRGGSITSVPGKPMCLGSHQPCIERFKVRWTWWGHSELHRLLSKFWGCWYEQAYWNRHWSVKVFLVEAIIVHYYVVCVDHSRSVCTYCPTRHIDSYSYRTTESWQTK